MKKYSISVDLVGDDVDVADAISKIQENLASTLPETTFSSVKAGGIKSFSEQGYKVWRARVTGITAKQAGDAHNPKATA